MINKHYLLNGEYRLVERGNVKFIFSEKVKLSFVSAAQIRFHFLVAFFFVKVKKKRNANRRICLTEVSGKEILQNFTLTKIALRMKIFTNFLQPNQEVP